MNKKRQEPTQKFGLFKLIHCSETQIVNINTKLYRNLCIVISIYYLLTILLLFFDVNILKDNLEDNYILTTRSIFIIHSTAQCILLLFVLDGVTEPLLICTTKKYLNVMTHLSYYWQFGLYWLLSCVKFYLICPVVIFSDIFYGNINIMISDAIHLSDHVVFFYFIYIMSLYMKLGTILSVLDDGNDLKPSHLFFIPVNKTKYVNQYFDFLCFFSMRSFSANEFPIISDALFDAVGC